MALYVDTKKITDEEKNLDTAIKNYEDNNTDFFYELEKLDHYFHDKNLNLIKDKMIKDKNSSSKVTDNLKKISDFYHQVVNIYNSYKGE